MDIKRSIWVTFQREGIHCYPDAKNIEGVEFLQYPHRHVFHFRVEVEVFHDDRDLEFIKEKRYMEGLFNNDVLSLQHKSCEMISDDLASHLYDRYSTKPRCVTIEISEDGENGCRVSYPAIRTLP